MAALGASAPRYQTVQTLGEHTYAVPDIVKLAHNKIVGILGVLFSPVLLLASILLLVLPKKAIDAFRLRFLPIVSNKLAERTSNQRKLLLQHVRGKVLDVGSGVGTYIRFLNNASHVVALEPSLSLHLHIQESSRKVGLDNFQVTIRAETLQQYASNGHQDGSFDWVILGNVLCEVEDLNQSLDLIHRLLKPGGHVYFSEHVGRPRGSWRRNVQDWMNPWWRRISGGCNCNRDSLQAIQGMPEWDVISWTFEGVTIGIGPLVMGLARKVEMNV
jgi:SAM-dependent methyltransferase